MATDVPLRPCPREDRLSLWRKRGDSELSSWRRRDLLWLYQSDSRSCLQPLDSASILRGGLSLWRADLLQSLPDTARALPSGT